MGIRKWGLIGEPGRCHCSDMTTTCKDSSSVSYVEILHGWDAAKHYSQRYPLAGLLLGISDQHLETSCCFKSPGGTQLFEKVRPGASHHLYPFSFCKACWKSWRLRLGKEWLKIELHQISSRVSVLRRWREVVKWEFLIQLEQTYFALKVPGWTLLPGRNYRPCRSLFLYHAEIYSYKYFRKSLWSVVSWDRRYIALLYQIGKLIRPKFRPTFRRKSIIYKFTASRPKWKPENPNR